MVFNEPWGSENVHLPLYYICIHWNVRNAFGAHTTRKPSKCSTVYSLEFNFNIKLLKFIVFLAWIGDSATTDFSILEVYNFIFVPRTKPMYAQPFYICINICREEQTKKCFEKGEYPKLREQQIGNDALINRLLHLNLYTHNCSTDLRNKIKNKIDRCLFNWINRCVNYIFK